MSSLAFDAGPIISLTTNSLLWILEPLQSRYKGSFCITPTVKYELVDRPLEGKKFKFEAFQVEKLIEQGTIDVVESIPLAQHLEKLANNCFEAQGKRMTIVQTGEMETIAYAITNDKTTVIDERITRMLIEEPQKLKNLLEKRFHFPINAIQENVRELQKLTSRLKIIRSAELVAVAFELGMLNKYVVKLPDAKKELLDSLLWGVKLQGCSISEEEINSIKKQITKQELR